MQNILFIILFMSLALNETAIAQVKDNFWRSNANKIGQVARDTKTSIKNYSIAVKNEGWRRLFTKATQNPVAIEPILKKSEKFKCIQILNPLFYFQIPSMIVGKLATGTAYDFNPVGAFNIWAERQTLKLFKPEQLDYRQFMSPLRTQLRYQQFTRPFRTLILLATFPFTGLGIFSESLTIWEQSLAKYEKLDYLSQFDYRYKDVEDLTEYDEMELKDHPETKNIFLEKTGLSSLNHDSIFNFNLLLISQKREMISSFLRLLTKHQIAYDSPIALGALRGDPIPTQNLIDTLTELEINDQKNHTPLENKEKQIAIKEIYQKVFTESLNDAVFLLFNDQLKFLDSNWKNKNLAAYRFQQETPYSDQQKNTVMKIALELLKAKEKIYQESSTLGKIKLNSENFLSFLNPKPQHSNFLGHLNDPFITDSLVKYEEESQTEPKLLPYHACAYLEWVAKFEIFKTLHITPLAYEYQKLPNGNNALVLTQHELTMKQVEKEILHNTIDKNNLPNLMSAYQEWKKKN